MARSLAGEAHLARNLFGVRYVRQGSWLLGAALIGGILAISKRRQTLLQCRFTQYLVLWTGIHTAVLTFIPGKFSAYYLAPLVPGIAALIAVTIDSLLPTADPAARAMEARRNVAMLAGVLSLTTSTAWFASRGAIPSVAIVFAGIAVAAAVSTTLGSKLPARPGTGTPGRTRRTPASLHRALVANF